MDGSGSRFRLAAPSSLIWHQWDDGCVVFNLATGQTHYLDDFTAYVLRLIEAEPRTLDELSAIVSDGLQREQSAPLHGQIVTALRNFDALGLVDGPG